MLHHFQPKPLGLPKTRQWLVSSAHTFPLKLQEITNRLIIQAFENTSTNIAAAQMRNALTSLSETVKDPDEKKVSRRKIPKGYADCS